MSQIHFKTIYLSIIHPTRTMSKNFKARRLQLMEMIEKIILNHVSNVKDGKPPKFVIRNQTSWDNVIFSNILTLKPAEEANTITVNFFSKCSQDKYSNIAHYLTKIYNLIATDGSSTIRELYYQDVHIMKSQRNVDSAIRAICCLLEASPWELGVMSTSKGLVAGPLVMKTNNDEVIDCDRTQGGVQVPQSIHSIDSFDSSAKFILIIEKDAIFQKILSEGILARMRKCVLITGKGYPDVNTRLLVHRLQSALQIPVLALVDADPFGIEIMCVYRFGSLSMALAGELLATPAVRWLGLLPGEIVGYAPPTVPLSQRDQRKLRELAVRPYFAADFKLRQQLNTLAALGRKAEIEGVAGLSSAYLTDRYLPDKIRAKDFI